MQTKNGAKLRDKVLDLSVINGLMLTKKKILSKLFSSVTRLSLRDRLISTSGETSESRCCSSMSKGASSGEVLESPFGCASLQARWLYASSGNASESIAVENDFWNTLLSLLAPSFKMTDGWLSWQFFSQIVNVMTNLKLNHNDFLKLNKYFLVPKSNFFWQSRGSWKNKETKQAYQNTTGVIHVEN